MMGLRKHDTRVRLPEPQSFEVRVHPDAFEKMRATSDPNSKLRVRRKVSPVPAGSDDTWEVVNCVVTRDGHDSATLEASAEAPLSEADGYDIVLVGGVAMLPPRNGD